MEVWVNLGYAFGFMFVMLGFVAVTSLIYSNRPTEEK